MSKHRSQPLIPKKGPTKGRPDLGEGANQPKVPPPKPATRPTRTPTGNRRGG
jgi:hypothetical protein